LVANYELPIANHRSLITNHRSPKKVNRKFRSQGDHGRCRANYRCCLPALAGFVSPQSMGPGTANVPQAQGGFKKNSWSKLRSGASSHCHRSADWQSAVSRIGNRLAIRPPAKYHSAKSRCIGTSLHYKPAPIRIGGSAKMPPLRPVRRRVKLGAWLQRPAEQGTYM